MKCDYLIGIDVGTSGTKSILFDRRGNLIASSSFEYGMKQRGNGWSEQNPEIWWDAVCKTLREIVSKKVSGEILGIGISAQMHSLVMLDKNNQVIRDAILWCDQRTGQEAKELEEAVGEKRLFEITSNPGLAGFTATKIMWVQKHEPEIFAKCVHILLPKDYIRFKLTGEFVTDVTDASGTQLFDVPKRKFSKEICDKLGIDFNVLPRVCESMDVSGYVCKEASALTGIKEGIPVAGGAGDTCASGIGTGVCELGKAFTTLGTSGVILANTQNPAPDIKGRVHSVCSGVPDEWCFMAVSQSAGMSLNWLRNNFISDKTYKEIDFEASKIRIGSDNLIFLPYLMGERTPILDDKARGMFFGLSSSHTKYHFARAVMEGVGFALNSCLDIVREVNIKIDSMAVCGGGAKSPFWRQMICDIYGMPIKTLKIGEGAALGAAILGGCAAGVFENVKDGCNKCVVYSGEVIPSMENHGRYMEYYKIYRELYTRTKEMYRELYFL